MAEDQVTNIEQEEKEPSSFRLVFTLGFAGFISGLILVSAYLFTKPIIDNNKAESLKAAIYKVLPGCTEHQKLIIFGDILKEFSPDEIVESGQTKGSGEVYAGYDSLGNLVGFAIPAAEPGFQDIIKVLFGYDGINKKIIGYEVLESKETPGLGDKIFKDQEFLSNFISLSVKPSIVAVKPGQKTQDNEVQTITGATISSKAIVRLLNNAIDKWDQMITRYLDATPMELSNKKSD